MHRAHIHWRHILKTHVRLPVHSEPNHTYGRKHTIRIYPCVSGTFVCVSRSSSVLSQSLHTKYTEHGIQAHTNMYNNIPCYMHSGNIGSTFPRRFCYSTSIASSAVAARPVRHQNNSRYRNGRRIAAGLLVVKQTYMRNGVWYVRSQRWRNRVCVWMNQTVKYARFRCCSRWRRSFGDTKIRNLYE